jgi:autotransporter-associated beta strand protein
MGEDNAPYGTLTLNTISRQIGSTVCFSFYRYVYQIGGAHYRIVFASPPALTNGMIGAWAVHDGRFATVDTYGIGDVPATADFGAGNNVVTTAGMSFTSDITVNSLVITSSSNNYALNVGGHRLQLNSGGLILNNNSASNFHLSNGELTVGAPNSELIVYANSYPYHYSSAIDLNIVDNGFSPVALVKSGAETLELSGVNTYSGGTYVAGGTLKINSANALPPNSLLDVTSAFLVNVANTAASFRLSALNMHVGANVNAPSSGAALNADNYDIEAGTLTARLTGTGTMTKTTESQAMVFAGPEYAGHVDVQAGSLIAFNGAFALGTGPVHVAANANLVNNATTLTNSITLQGDLSGSGAPTFSGPIAVTGQATITTFDVLNASMPPLALTLAGPVLIAPACSLTSVARGTIRFNGGITNNGTLSLGTASATATALSGNGALILTDGANLKMTGPAMTNKLELAGYRDHWTAALDLSANYLILNGNRDQASQAVLVANLANQLSAARRNGDWMGTGITSSTVAADHSATGSHLTTLALFDNADLNLAKFHNQPLDADALVITTALIGDADLNASVDATDFNIWYAHAGQICLAQSQGDFDLSGGVDGRDFDLWYAAAGDLAQPTLDALGLDRATLSAVQVPEPASALLALATPLLLLKRRRAVRRSRANPNR